MVPVFGKFMQNIIPTLSFIKPFQGKLKLLSILAMFCPLMPLIFQLGLILGGLANPLSISITFLILIICDISFSAILRLGISHKKPINLLPLILVLGGLVFFISEIFVIISDPYMWQIGDAINNYPSAIILLFVVPIQMKIVWAGFWIEVNFILINRDIADEADYITNLSLTLQKEVLVYFLIAIGVEIIILQGTILTPVESSPQLFGLFYD